MKLALRPVTVEDDAVESDADNLDDQLDNDADKGPVLQAADETVVNILALEFRASVLNASPSPHILVAAILLRVLEDSSSRCPHGHAENEPSDSKKGVVDSDLLGTLVTAAAVSDKDSNADGK